MRKSSAALMTAGIILSVIIIVWQLVPFLTYQELEISWSEEAEKYLDDVFWDWGIPPRPPTHEMIIENAEEIARQTDFIVHLIDARVGGAMAYWNISQSQSMFPGRYCWNEDLKEMSLGKTTCWERLTEAEELLAVSLHVDWSFEAVKYYWNPGDPYFGVPDQPDFMIEVIRLATDGEAEFREMFANATVKAEELANATDQVVDLVDLVEAIASILP